MSLLRARHELWMNKEQLRFIKQPLLSGLIMMCILLGAVMEMHLESFERQNVKSKWEY